MKARAAAIGDAQANARNRAQEKQWETKVAAAQRSSFEKLIDDRIRLALKNYYDATSKEVADVLAEACNEIDSDIASLRAEFNALKAKKR